VRLGLADCGPFASGPETGKADVAVVPAHDPEQTLTMSATWHSGLPVCYGSFD
jgi:hypothetical protein